MTKKNNFDPVNNLDNPKPTPTINPWFILILVALIAGFLCFFLIPDFKTKANINLDCVETAFLPYACSSFAFYNDWKFIGSSFYFECININRTDTTIVMYHLDEVIKICPKQ